MTVSSSRIYHRGYKKGDILDIHLKNGIVYKKCIYSHIGYNNTAMFIHNSGVLFIPRHKIDDITLVKKSPFRKRDLYVKKGLHRSKYLY